MTLQGLNPYLDDLEERRDEAAEDSLFREWGEFAAGRCNDQLFSPRRAVRRPPRVAWPAITLNDTLRDPPLMLLHQLSVNSRILAAGTGELLAIRANFGTPILPSMYGKNEAGEDLMQRGRLTRGRVHCWNGIPK